MIILYIILGIVGLLILLNIILFLIVLKSYNKIFNTRFEPSPLVKYYEASEYNLDSKKIEIKCENETIRGNIYTHGNYDENKIIVFVHGMNACKDAYMQEIGTLCQNGFMVLGFDHIGVYESTGKLKGISSSVRTLDYVINYVKNNEELKDKDIYVVGHSWGAYATINIVKYHKDIKGIVALAPFVNVSSFLRYSMNRKNPLVILMIKLIELFR
ncbi:MAG: lysophospholipase, partial [Acholeplasmatales bacterium]|nr:lysophospholipase [Acholeplasmatales bacterium]